MNAKRCDKCKRFYNKPPEGANKLKLVKISETASRYTKSVDLCPDCERSLEKWFNDIEKAEEG